MKYKYIIARYKYIMGGSNFNAVITQWPHPVSVFEALDTNYYMWMGETGDIKICY